MGVADNKTYKNDYIFTDNKRTVAEDNPSINDDPKINSTIKENPYRANVEIEGKEVVLQDDLSALFKAVGKRHSQGGMDVLLKPNAFVFSDFDELKISQKEHELFELKEGGTPAETLKKNVDVKHYNTLSNILSDPQKDDLAKKSSARMIEKYIKTLGNIAYIQESKKGFPQGLPQFAQNTAPVYDDTVKDTIDSNKQYAKAGGTILPKAQYGNNPFAYKRQDIPKWILAPKPISNNWDNSGRFVPSWPPVVVNTQTKTQNKTQNRVSGHPILPETTQSATYFQNLKQDTVEEIIADIISSSTPPSTDSHPQDTPQGTSVISNITKDKVFDPKVEEVKGEAQGSKVADWQFTPWQKLSQLYNWGQYANTKRYMPIRSHFDATYTEPVLMNPEQQIGDIKGMTNQQISSLGTLNPILRNAQAAASTGELLNQIAQVRSQYDNQNTQILNQNRQYNNQLKNQETQINMANDQQYYKEAVEGRKNFDNMRQFTANNAFNNTLRDVETNQKLAYNLLTQNNPAYNFNWKTGKFDRTNKSILDAQGDAKNDYLTKLIGEQYKGWDNMNIDQRNTFLKLLLTKGFMPGVQAQVPDLFGSQKKGGRVGKNPYKNNNKY